MMPLGSECCKGSKLLVDLFLESYTRRTTLQFLKFHCEWYALCTTPETNKGSKLLVDFFLESYTRRTTHNGISKNCTVANIAIKAFLRV